MPTSTATAARERHPWLSSRRTSSTVGRPSYGEKEVPEEELAMMFLLRLDMTRYGAKYTEMQNDAANRKEC